MFIRLDKIPERDGRTDKQRDAQTDREPVARAVYGSVRSYYYSRQCEQCGRAVKNLQVLYGLNFNDYYILHK